MRAVSFMYHDIFDPDALAGSGFAGIRGNRCSLQRREFQAHIGTLSQHLNGSPAVVGDLLYGQGARLSAMLTFDDGGASAYTIVMDILDRFGWKAHFFVPTDFIGKTHFLNSSQIKSLRARGHTIGSHSRSHPPMMSSKDRDSVRREWLDSVKCLSDILGEKVDSASLPGGYYSRLVAEAASSAGIRALFTSEPTRLTHLEADCRIFGRYVIGTGTAHDREVRLLRGGYVLRANEYVVWNLKKLAKTLGGERYIRLRALALERELL